MVAAHGRKSAAGLVSIPCFVATLLFLTLPDSGSEETRPETASASSEKAKKVWEAQARCVADAMGLTAEETSKVVRAYVSARQDHAEKIRSLPNTPEAVEQKQILAEKARSSLGQSLAKAIAAEKIEQVLRILAPFGPSRLVLDRMVGQLMAFNLPMDKLNKALLGVLEFNRDVSKAISDARKAGSWQGLGEKVDALTDSLNEEVSKLLTEEQATLWKKKYAPPLFGGPRREK